MEDFGTFVVTTHDGHSRTWRVFASINEETLEVDFIRLQFGGTMPGPELRPDECSLPHELAALARISATRTVVEEDDFMVIDDGDFM